MIEANDIDKLGWADDLLRSRIETLERCVTVLSDAREYDKSKQIEIFRVMNERTDNLEEDVERLEKENEKLKEKIDILDKRLTEYIYYKKC